MKILNFLVLKHDEKPSFIKTIVNIIIVLCAFYLVFSISLGAIGISLDFSVLSKFKIRIIKGFNMTIALSFSSLLLSLIIGILSAIGNNSRILPIKYLCSIYVKFIRGTPLIMQIYLFFYIIGTAWGISNRFVAGVLILSIFEGAYISEIIRGSLLSINKTQLEAAKAVGFTKYQTAKHVILPQLTQRTLPALTGQFASIIKDSSLLSMIAVIELTQTMREITAINFRMFESYFLLGLLYLALTLPLNFITSYLEKKSSY